MVASADRVIVVRFKGRDWQELWDLTEAANQDYFSHNLRNPPTTPVKRVALLCSKSHVVALGLAQTQYKSTRLDTKVSFSSVREFEMPLEINQLVAAVPKRSRLIADDAMASDSVLPPVAGKAVLDALRSLRPEAAHILQLLSSLQTSEPLATSSHRQQLLAEQRDALALGLEVAGLDSRAALKYWELPGGDAPFMAGLSDPTTSEAALIRHDSTHLDDWTNIDGRIQDVIEFYDPDDPYRRVTAIYADKEPLEQQLGTDLVYYRHNNPGYVAVQYKRMKREPTESDPTKAVYRPDSQLDEEIERMRRIQAQPGSVEIEDWRLSTEPFYIKLCDGLMSRPQNNRLVMGMYFPLGLFEILLESPQVLGPKGGKAIGWHNAGRYLSNGEFVELLKHGWIGSAGATTAGIAAIVNASLARKRSVTVIIDETEPSKAKKIQRR